MSVNIDIAKFEKKVADAVSNELLALGAMVAAEIQRNTPISTGALGGSFTAKVGEPVEGGVSVQVGSPLWWQYGAHVEFGTRPHWAPIAPLIMWVRNSMGVKAVGVSFKGGKAVPARKGTMRMGDNEVTRIAYAIRANIAKRGTREQLFVLHSIATMGIPYVTSFGKGDMKYLLDVSGYLRSRNIWGTIGATT
jgi:hypothetical protein